MNQLKNHSDKELLACCEIVTPEFTSNMHKGIFDRYKNEFGWEKYEISQRNDNNYQGAIIFKKEECILIHRGMQNEFMNFLNCCMIAKYEMPPIVQDALIMAKKAQGYNKPIIHTGFSLGGFLAQITCCFVNCPSKAVCYDPPGAAFVIESKNFKSLQKNNGSNQENVNNIFVYVTEPNPVNTAAQYIGYVRQIIDDHLFKGNIYLKNQKWEIKSGLNVMDLLNNLGSSHSRDVLMQILRNHKSDNFKYRSIQYWPVANNKLLADEKQLFGIFLTMFMMGNVNSSNKDPIFIHSVENNKVVPHDKEDVIKRIMENNDRFEMNKTI